MELCKAVEAVIQLGKRSVHTMNQPGWAGFLEAHAAHEQAQAQIDEARKRFRSVLTPGAFRAAHAALLALDVATAAFQSIAHEHSEVLNQEAYNEMGNHLPRTRRDDLPSLL
jgi:pyruvate carboxylase